MVRSKRTANRPPGQSPQGPPGQTLVAVEHTEWAGPLPAPETLEEFDRIVRGSAQTIIDEWRAESEHRRRFERRALVLQGAEQIGGRLLAFLFAVAALGVTAFLAIEGAEWAAGILGAGTIGSVVLALISGRSR